jgi:hypothetical protein
VATAKTALTELGTAAGLFYEPDQPWPEAIEHLAIPGLADEVWKPVVLPATATGAADRDLLLTALDNGRTFRKVVLGGRVPAHVEWAGGHRAVWSADVPRDLAVDGVYFIQAKFDSRCVLNKAPAAVFDDLLLERDEPPATSWYGDVAPRELAAYYRLVRDDLAERSDLLESAELPDEVDDLDRAGKDLLKSAMRARDGVAAAEAEAYAELCRTVSDRTADRWQARWSRATPAVQARMVMRLLRISGGPYWLLGTKGTDPLRLAVADTLTWQSRFALKSFAAHPATAGQPQVDWRAEVADRSTQQRIQIEGCCEIRWSHGKLQGAPECKVQVTTPLADLPGYDPLDA